MIKDSKKESVDITAYSKDSATIFITADSTEKASSLLLQAEPKAKEAMQNWEPVEKDETKEKEPQKHYYVCSRAKEDAQAEIDEYKATTAGKRFIDAQQTATAFCYKHSKGGMTWNEINYYFNLCAGGGANGVLEAINYAYCTAYRRGFNTAKRKAAKC